MNIYIFFFWKAIKIAGSAQKTGSVGLGETQVFVLGLNRIKATCYQREATIPHFLI